MTMLEHALALAAKGFYVFPLIGGRKRPIKDMHFPTMATRDEAQIRAWWAADPDHNIGISTSQFGDGESLLAVDVDNKGTKKGDDDLLRLELEGCDFPATLEHRTPTGGRHLIYRCPEPVNQRKAGFLAPGLDLRARGGYIVAPGSVVDAGPYTVGDLLPIAPAPQWLIDRCGRAPERAEPAPPPENVDQERASLRALRYLTTEAPRALEGDHGDQTTYMVACRVKDFGVDEAGCLDLMTVWNAECSPPWLADELEKKVANAYRYGQEVVGAAAPEAQFEPVSEVEKSDPEENLHPFARLNKNFAFVTAGGGHHILWEAKDPDGKFKLEHLNEGSFHKKFAADVLAVGDGKTKPVTELWMKHADRRSYDGVCFRPGRVAPDGWYNLWRGFAVEPLAKDEKPTKEMQHALDAFLDHARVNVCRDDRDLFKWLLGYFAHLVQNPWEKPLVALVFRGGKGVGKNALVDRVGALLGNHYLLTSNRRYLIGNFNGHLENCLMFALDEAFWSGDKQAEGVLKDLITGKSHVIEHKGKEPYGVENCTRVVIIGNEDWLVPSSNDERRFAVFDVGDGRKQDRAFFIAMRERMERGGYRLLLRYLLDFDLTGIDVNEAPKTAALMDQKVESLNPVQAWWLDCLTEGRIVGSEFGGEWPKEVDKERFRAAFRRHARERNIRGRLPEDRAIGKLMKTCLPSIDGAGKRREGSELVNVYRLPGLEQARTEWAAFIGHEISWD